MRGHEDPEGEYRYSSTLSLTLELDVVGGQSKLRLLQPEEGDRLDGPQGRVGRVWKNSPPPGFHLQTLHPVSAKPKLKLKS